MGYLFLILTIVTESAAVILMKQAHGFLHKTVLGFAAGCYALAFVFLTLTLKYLPAGLANATWAGASTLLVVWAGMFFFKEYLSVAQWLFVLLIAIGLVGLNLVKGTS